MGSFVQIDLKKPKRESDEFVIIDPTKCLAAQATGGIELSLGNDRLYLKKIKGGTTNFEFYLGGSRMELEEGKECTPATNRAYLNKTHQHELVGGSIIRAEIDFRMEEGEATYTTEDNTLLTSSGEKVTFDERFMEIEITPYFPTIVDHKSITLFLNSKSRTSFLSYNFEKLFFYLILYDFLLLPKLASLCTGIH